MSAGTLDLNRRRWSGGSLAKSIEPTTAFYGSPATSWNSVRWNKPSNEYSSRRRGSYGAKPDYSLPPRHQHVSSIDSQRQKDRLANVRSASDCRGDGRTGLFGRHASLDSAPSRKPFNAGHSPPTRADHSTAASTDRWNSTERLYKRAKDFVHQIQSEDSPSRVLRHELRSRSRDSAAPTAELRAAISSLRQTAYGRASTYVPPAPADTRRMSGCTPISENLTFGQSGNRPSINCARPPLAYSGSANALLSRSWPTARSQSEGSRNKLSLPQPSPLSRSEPSRHSFSSIGAFERSRFDASDHSYRSSFRSTLGQHRTKPERPFRSHYGSPAARLIAAAQHNLLPAVKDKPSPPPQPPQRAATSGNSGYDSSSDSTGRLDDAHLRRRGSQRKKRVGRRNDTRRRAAGPAVDASATSDEEAESNRHCADKPGQQLRSHKKPKSTRTIEEQRVDKIESRDQMANGTLLSTKQMDSLLSEIHDFVAEVDEELDTCKKGVNEHNAAVSISTLLKRPMQSQGATTTQLLTSVARANALATVHLPRPTPKRRREPAKLPEASAAVAARFRAHAVHPFVTVTLRARPSAAAGLEVAAAATLALRCVSAHALCTAELPSPTVAHLSFTLPKLTKPSRLALPAGGNVGEDEDASNDLDYVSADDFSGKEDYYSPSELSPMMPPRRRRVSSTTAQMEIALNKPATHATVAHTAANPACCRVTAQVDEKRTAVRPHFSTERTDVRQPPADNSRGAAPLPPALELASRSDAVHVDHFERPAQATMLASPLSNGHDHSKRDAADFIAKAIGKRPTEINGNASGRPSAQNQCQTTASQRHFGGAAEARATRNKPSLKLGRLPSVDHEMLALLTLGEQLSASCSQLQRAPLSQRRAEPLRGTVASRPTLVRPSVVGSVPDRLDERHARPFVAAPAQRQPLHLFGAAFRSSCEGLTQSSYAPQAAPNRFDITASLPVLAARADRAEPPTAHRSGQAPLEAAARKIDQMLHLARDKHQQHRTKFREAVTQLDQIYEDIKKESSEFDSWNYSHGQRDLDRRFEGGPFVAAPTQRQNAPMAPWRPAPFPVDNDEVVRPRQNESFTQKWLENDLSSWTNVAPRVSLRSGERDADYDDDVGSVGSASAEVAAIVNRNVTYATRKRHDSVSSSKRRQAVIVPSPLQYATDFVVAPSYQQPTGSPKMAAKQTIGRFIHNSQIHEQLPRRPSANSDTMNRGPLNPARTMSQHLTRFVEKFDQADNTHQQAPKRLGYSGSISSVHSLPVAVPCVADRRPNPPGYGRPLYVPISNPSAKHYSAERLQLPPPRATAAYLRHSMDQIEAENIMADLELDLDDDNDQPKRRSFPTSHGERAGVDFVAVADDRPPPLRYAAPPPLRYAAPPPRAPAAAAAAAAAEQERSRLQARQLLADATHADFGSCPAFDDRSPFAVINAEKFGESRVNACRRLFEETPAKRPSNDDAAAWTRRAEPTAALRALPARVVRVDDDDDDYYDNVPVFRPFKPATTPVLDIWQRQPNPTKPEEENMPTAPTTMSRLLHRFMKSAPSTSLSSLQSTNGGTAKSNDYTIEPTSDSQPTKAPPTINGDRRSNTSVASRLKASLFGNRKKPVGH